MKSWSASELEKLPTVHEGDTFFHAVCGQTHSLECASNTDGSKATDLLFYTCNGKHYLAAVNNKWVGL